MVAIPSRHKSLVLLAGIIVLQVLLLAVQIKRESKGRLIRVWTVGAASPFERAGSYGFGWVRDTWRHYFALQNTTKENEQIRHENDALKLQITQLQGKAAEADRLAALLNFRQSHAGVPMIAARVIGASAGAASQTIQLDRGERDGIRKNMGVITPDGVVGKVVESYPNAAQVLLLYFRGKYAEHRDSIFEAMYLPYPQAWPRFEAAMAKLREDPITSEGHASAKLFLPALGKERSQRSSPAIRSSRFASNRQQISSAWRKCWFFCRFDLSR